MARRRTRADEMQELARDPIVAAYLREVEQMPQMTREGEIHLMKQIEAGKREAWHAIASSPLMTKEVLRIWKTVRKG